MKVLFFLTNLSNRGGTERSCFLVCNELAKTGYDVHLFCLSGDVDNLAFPLDKAVHIHLLNINARGIKLLLTLPSIVFKLKKYIQENGIGFLISVEVMACLFTLPLLLVTDRKKLKFIVWEHFNFTVDLGLKLRKTFRKIAARNADAIVTLTLKDKDMWETNLAPRAKVFAVYNPSPFPISTSNYSSASCSIIAVGRVTYQKGFDLLLESWKLAVERIREAGGNWKLSIIGDGEDKAQISALISSLELEDSVELVGNTIHIAQYYTDASFLCMSSRYEGLPMVLIEAQSYGLPVVAFDCLTGPSEIVTGNSGMLCKAFNTNEFADSIVNMAADSEGRALMSANAKISATRFAPDKIREMWTNVFESL